MILTLNPALLALSKTATPTWFSKLSRNAQIEYLRRHPRSKYGSANIRKEAKKLIDKDKKKKGKSTKPIKPKQKAQPEVEDDTTDEIDDTTEDDTTDDDTDEEVQEKVESVLDKEKEAKIEEKRSLLTRIQSGMKAAKTRVKALTKLTKRRFKTDIKDSLSYVGDLVSGKTPNPDHKSAAKRVVGGVMSALLIVGVGAALYANAGPVARILADEWIAHKQWMGQDKSESTASLSSERNDLDLESMIKDMADFVQNYDQDQLLDLLEQEVDDE